MTARLLSLALQPKDEHAERFALNVFNDFTLNPAIRAMYDYATVSSYDTKELEVAEGEKEDEVHYDDQTLNKVADALIAENFTPDSAQDVIRILLNAGIVFRERG